MRQNFVVALAFATVLTAPLLAACDSTPAESSTDAVQQRLVGHWLREYEQEGSTIRRLLVLQSDGHFVETAKAVDGSGVTSQHIHEGGWLFDGTNLKRKYTVMDGKHPSAPTVPFATFEIRFESNREFVGTDHVHRREVRYQRVQEGTVP
jgi:hypothetical protein